MVKKNKLVEVEWQDSCVYRGWQYTEQAKVSVPSQCRSVGYMLEKDGDRIVLALSMDDDGDSVADVMCIPMATVKKVRNVKT